MALVKGELYQCPGCGAEVEVTQSGGGSTNAGPTCPCGQAMRKRREATASAIR